MSIIYFLVGLLASIFGSVAGLGGGVIIKPILDLIGDYDVATIGILSAVTVLSMSCISLLTSIRSQIKINVKSSLFLAIGSIVGGIIGKSAFNSLVNLINSSDIVTVIQAAILAGLMIIIYILVKFRSKIRTFHLENPIAIIGIGVLLGMIAGFLGIGGGPFNVAILAILFQMGVKESTLNSIFIIFFSQISAILLTTFTTGFASFNLTMLPFMIAGGILGGYFGSRLASIVSSHFVERVFAIAIIGVTLTNVFNVVRYFL